ncbi:MAG: hypothetical protein ACOC5T_08530 [Elusimicrobiota bacterium]
MPKTKTKRKTKPKPTRKKSTSSKSGRPWLTRDIKPNDLPNVYKLLSEKFPKEAIVEGRLWYGLETEGPRGQSVINRLNEVLGLNHWHYEYNIEDELRGKLWSATCGLTLMIGNWKTIKAKASSSETIDVGIDKTVFIPLVSRSWVGGVSHMSRSEAKKGAITNTLKKCAAALGVAKDIYERLAEPEFDSEQEVIEEKNKTQTDKKAKKSPINEKPLQVNKKGDSYAQLLTELNSVQDKESFLKVKKKIDEAKNNITASQLQEAVKIFVSLKKKYN